MVRSRLKQLEVYLPAIPILICVFIFLGADYYPSLSPDQAGLVWRECRISQATYSDISSPIQVARCFHDETTLVAAGENFLDEKAVSKPFFLEANRPYNLDGQTILLARLGVKYFIMYNGHKVGPVFNYVLVDTEGESEMVGVMAGQGCYVFRGIRNGHYYLIEISQNDATISGLVP
jgi:hypothetical protein